MADGIRVDCDRNHGSSAANGVHRIAPDVHKVGKALVPDDVSDRCWGGRGHGRLQVATSLDAVTLDRGGARRPWPRPMDGMVVTNRMSISEDGSVIWTTQCATWATPRPRSWSLSSPATPRARWLDRPPAPTRGA